MREVALRDSLPGWARALLCLAVAIGLGCLGLAQGSVFAYAVAGWQDRDIAELKGMAIVATLATGLVLFCAGIWLALLATGGGRLAVRGWGWVSGAAAVLAAGLVALAYEPIKENGIPVVHHEIRLPAGLRELEPQNVDVTIWNGRSGQGCHLADVVRKGDRQVVRGSCAAYAGYQEQTQSLTLGRKSEGHWKLPLSRTPTLERDFGPWRPDRVPGARPRQCRSLAGRQLRDPLSDQEVHVEPLAVAMRALRRPFGSRSSRFSVVRAVILRPPSHFHISGREGVDNLPDGPRTETCHGLISS